MEIKPQETKRIKHEIELNLRGSFEEARIELERDCSLESIHLRTTIVENEWDSSRSKHLYSLILQDTDQLGWLIDELTCFHKASKKFDEEE